MKTTDRHKLIDRINTLEKLTDNGLANIISVDSECNNLSFGEEIAKFERCPKDENNKFEKELCDFNVDIKFRKSKIKKTARLDEYVRFQRISKDLEMQRNEKRINLYNAQNDFIERKVILLPHVQFTFFQKSSNLSLLLLIG